MKFLRLFFLILILSVGSAFGTVADDFANANAAYARHDFGQAISTYETLLRRGETRPEIYYNLGLAYEGSANPAKAVLNYERALLLSPGLSEAQSHLDRLSSQTSQLWWEKIPRFGSNASVIAAVCGAWFFILSLVARWRFLGGTRNLWTALAGLSAIVILIAAASFYYRDFPLASPNRAIVLKAENLHSNFTESSATILALRPGQAVEITSINGPWTNCLLPDQTRGWVSTEALERVVPES